MNLGRVFAILRRWTPVGGHSMLTIWSQHVAAAAPAQGPDITAVNPSGDDSHSRQGQEGVKTVLTIATPFVEAITLAGPALEAAVGGLLELLKATDVSSILSERLDLVKN